MKRKIFFITVFSLFVFSFSVNVFADSGLITQINFTSLSQSININTASLIFTVQTQNVIGVGEPISESGTKINLASSSSTGQFSDANSTTCTGDFSNAPLSLGMNKTWENKHFCYKNSIPGIYTITISVVEGQSWTSAIQQITIVDPTPPTLKENIIIKNGNIEIDAGQIDLPNTGSVDILDNTGVSHPVDAKSVVAIIDALSKKNSKFSLSDLTYYNTTSFPDSFIINCITPKDSEPLCYDWHYVIDNSYPYDAVNKKILIGGENLYIYFGPQNKVLLSSNSIKNTESITVTAKKYDYENNNWVIRTDVTIGLTQPNPDDQWNPIDDIKTAVDPVTGIATFSSVPVGEYDVGVKEDYYWPTEKLTVTETTYNNGGGGGNPPILHHKVDIDNALRYLSEKQNSDGSFSSDLYTDWAGIAIASTNNNLVSKEKVTNYLKTTPLISSTLTDNERHAMAMMSLGINPYSGTEINYIKKITDSFDGTQFGDENLVNDDIFALIVLANAGYSSSDEIISKDVKYLLDPLKQPLDGSWGSIDMTSAVIQALKPFSDLNGANEAISLAKNYLINSQQPDGGFNNSSSTSWVLQAIGALGEDSLTWEKNNLNPNDYLFTLQQIDGGFESLTSDENNRIWATSYAIPAVMGKSWGNIMQSFSKPVTQNNFSGDVLENTDLQTPTNPVVCPKGDLFSTTTGQACTATNETNFIVSNIPITNPNLSLVKKIENKKNVETPQEKNIKKPNSQIFGSPTSKTFTESNLGASVGNTVPIKISVKKILQVVSHLVISILTYIGKGFVDLIIFLQNQIVAIFK